MQRARTLRPLTDGRAREALALLLDEPIASLDLAHKEVVLDAARRFASHLGNEVCAVPHDLNLASQYADQIAVSVEGRVAALKPSAAVRTEPILQRALATDVMVTRQPKLRRRGQCQQVAHVPRPADPPAGATRNARGRPRRSSRT